MRQGLVMNFRLKEYVILFLLPDLEFPLGQIYERGYAIALNRSSIIRLS